jgi:hypothetical protein
MEKRIFSLPEPTAHRQKLTAATPEPIASLIGTAPLLRCRNNPDLALVLVICQREQVGRRIRLS